MKSGLGTSSPILQISRPAVHQSARRSNRYSAPIRGLNVVADLVWQHAAAASDSGLLCALSSRGKVRRSWGVVMTTLVQALRNRPADGSTILTRLQDSPRNPHHLRSPRDQSRVPALPRARRQRRQGGGLALPE